MKTIKYLVAVCVLLVSFSSCTEKQKKNLKKTQLYGKVKSVILHRYEVLEDSLEIKKGKELYTETKEYSAKGKLIKMVKKNMYGKDTSIMKLDYIYDKKNHLIELKSFVKDEKVGSVTFKNHEKGYPVQANVNNCCGEILKSTFVYDENGNQIEKKRYQDNDLKSICYYKYDKKGNNIQENWCDVDGKVKDTYEYEYDEFGNNIRERNYKKDNGSFELVFEKTFKYEFDKKGNWIKKVVYKDKKPFVILEREFEYYE